MEKTGKVRSINYDGTFDSNFGTLHKHNICMENGDTGQYSSKYENQTYFKVGEEVKYIFEDGQHPKIKTFNDRPQNASKGGKKMSNVSFGVSYVKDLIVADKISIKDWQSASEKIIKFMNKMES